MTKAADAATLYAPLTAAGRAAIAVIRLSGPRALAVAERIGGTLPPPRRASRRRLIDPQDQDLIDDALVVTFPAPNSFTGEDVVEFHLHGGPVPTRRLLEVLARTPGLLAAAPGDFSRRAFLNGRLDLTQAEAIADLVAADTAAQARQALRQLDGAFGRRIADWQARLHGLRVPLEAALDFADEGDVNGEGAGDAALARLVGEIGKVLADGRGERLRDGLRVAIVGAPNVGKSSLLNALAGRDVAIVTAVPGTTRDLLEVALELDGLPLTLVDTAGLRETADVVEAEGVRRARAAAADAEVRIGIVDGTRPLATAAVVEQAELLVWSKADLAPVPIPLGGRAPVPISTVAADGLDVFVAALRELASARLAAVGSALWTRERHRQALWLALAELEGALAQADPVLRAEGLRLAQRALGTITGESGVEALLDGIFATFCIGK